MRGWSPSPIRDSDSHADRPRSEAPLKKVVLRDLVSTFCEKRKSDASCTCRGVTFKERPIRGYK